MKRSVIALIIIALLSAVVLPFSMQSPSVAEAGGIVFTVDGELVGFGIDTYVVTLEGGKIYQAFLNCPEGSDASPVIDIYDPFFLPLTIENWANDNCVGGGSVAFFGAEFSGDYIFDLYNLFSPAAAGFYTFQIVEVETVVNEIVEFTATTPEPLPIDPLYGSLPRGVGYEVYVPAGALLVAALTCPADDALDPALIVYDSSGNFVGLVDDTTSAVCFFGPFGAPILVWQSLVSDTYTIYAVTVEFFGGHGSETGLMQNMIGVINGTGAPNLGLINVGADTMGYMSAGGEVYGPFIGDADGTGADVMQIAAITTDADGNEWVGLWMGSTNYIWIPITAGEVIWRK